MFMSEMVQTFYEVEDKRLSNFTRVVAHRTACGSLCRNNAYVGLLVLYHTERLRDS